MLGRHGTEREDVLTYELGAVSGEQGSDIVQKSNKKLSV